MTEENWQLIETAPKDGTPVRVKLANGRETIAEYWAPPPVEYDPEQTGGGWAIDALPSFCDDTMEDLDCDIVGWMPLPEPQR